jgi:AcrR family transcriptional regulator
MPTDVVLTDRTRETYRSLLDAARWVFEIEGYDGASISQIVERANVARGTFYVYFESKEDILRTIADEIEATIQDMQTGLVDLEPDGERVVEMIRAATARFLQFYRDNARIMAVLEQVATHQPAFRKLRLRMRRSAAARAIKLITRLQEHGLVPANLDARYAAIALTGMVDRFAYVWFVLEEDFEESTAVDVLSRLWYQAVTAAPSPLPSD